ncbi:MAG TPA: ABC-type transport auxiliary lipoprotein family protein [Rhizomicrobium sp.]|nr:ABC-type transport auxiliary lipoprotein family protein [Rhizomicrobium sp.]
MSIDTFVAPSRRGVLTGVASLGLASCSGNLIGPPSPAPQIYVLNPRFGPVTDAPNVPWQLIVSAPNAPASLDTQRIALVRAPNTMDYYANSEWTDRAPILLQSLLVQAFENSGRIATVGRETAGIRADYVLETEVRDFEAYYAVADTAPVVRVTLMAKLLGAVNHDVAAAMEFRNEAQASANNMTSITAAFNQATGATIQAIVAWALRQRLSKPPA